MDLNVKLKIPKEWSSFKTIEMHTGGEPLRIFIDGIPDIQGNTILEKKRYFSEKYDLIRTGTMWEPRGHADMYGAVLTEPVTPDGDIGVFFLHNEGYSTMCGHAIIALTRLVLETGIVKKEDNRPQVMIDTPSGRVRSYAKWKGGEITEVSFLNVPSFLFLENESINVPGIGHVNFDVAFGGAFYAICDVKELGLNMDSTDYMKLLDYGKKIKKAVVSNFNIRHPENNELGFLYGTIFTGDPYDYKHHSRNVCVFADGEVDRSATGTGVSARAALHFAKSELKIGEKITVESILGTTMDVKITDVIDYGPYKAVIPEVTGNAWYTGQNEFWFDPGDPLKQGFIFR